jgi:hypothetical protein
VLFATLAHIVVLKDGFPGLPFSTLMPASPAPTVLPVIVARTSTFDRILKSARMFLSVPSPMPSELKLLCESIWLPVMDTTLVAEPDVP